MDVIRSVYEKQSDIIDAIEYLHIPKGIECDVTYGNGKFYEGRKEPKYRFDIDDTLHGDIVVADSQCLPIDNCSVRSVMFDPPFLTYVRTGRTGNGKMVMAKRFGGYWRYDELEDHYRGTISESCRVLNSRGVLVVKCQDIVHNHKLHSTHTNVIGWAENDGFRLLDMFVLVASHRMPSPNRAGIQKHARIFHSYFLVFRKIQ
jgi:hypothetical protein